MSYYCRRFVLFDLRLYRVLFLKVSMSARYDGAMPCNALLTSSNTLNIQCMIQF